MTDSVLDVQQLGFAYPGADAPLFHDFALTVEPGEVVAVQGTSGSGKSTLLFLLGLFLTPGRGRIGICGIETTELDDRARSRIRGSQVGFVFQDAALHDAISIEESVAEGALYLGTPYRSALARARELLAAYGVGEIGGRSRAEVSGGQAQRAALCRALIRDPVLILADEPTGNLDAVNAGAVIAGLRGAADERGTAVVIVTHSVRVASDCDRIVGLP